MKIAVIGDVFVEPDYFSKQISQLPWRDEVEILTYNWGVKDIADFQRHQRLIEENGPENMMYPAELENDITNVVAIFTHMCPLPEKLLNKADNLQLIGTCRGGLEHISDYAVKQKIPLINTIRNAEPVADFTIGLIIAETRNIARAHTRIKQGEWPNKFSNSAFTSNLCDLTIGLIGFGNIGRRVASKIISLGAKVLVYDEFLTDEQIMILNPKVEICSLTEIYQQSDVISIHIRFEKQQQPLIGTEAFSQMKKNCILVNTSRAYAVDEKALITALQEQKIAGAALDVFHQEPLDPAHPFLKMENITLTAHLAGDTVQAIPKSPKLLVKEILKAQASRPLSIFSANKRKG